LSTGGCHPSRLRCRTLGFSGWRGNFAPASVRICFLKRSIVLIVALARLEFLSRKNFLEKMHASPKSFQHSLMNFLADKCAAAGTSAENDSSELGVSGAVLIQIGVVRIIEARANEPVDRHDSERGARDGESDGVAQSFQTDIGKVHPTQSRCDCAF